MLSADTTALCHILAVEMFKLLVIYFDVPDTMYHMLLSGTPIKVKILGTHKDIKTHTAVYSGYHTRIGSSSRTKVQYIQKSPVACEIYKRSIKQT